MIKSQDEGWSLVFSKNIQILMFVLFCFGCLGKRQIEAQKLDFEKEKWIHQLKVDENKIRVDERRLELDKEKTQLEFQFQREEKQKDREQLQSKDKLNLAIACINSGCLMEDIERISQILGLN